MEDMQHLGWGRLCLRDKPTPYPGERWGLDNGAYMCWRKGMPFDGDLFLRRLDKAYAMGMPYMAVVPDIVAAGIDSLIFSQAWRKRLPSDWPWFLAVQDGMEISDVEPILGSYTGLFLGGTNRFKSDAALWCDLSHRHGKLFHYGRCGTWFKFRHARDMGADSLDSAGMVYEQWKWERFKRWYLQGAEQMELTLPVVGL